MSADQFAPLDALHRPIPLYPGDCASPESHGGFDPAEEFCRDCEPEFEACETCHYEDGEWVEWPCPTAKAVAEARALASETVESVEWGVRYHASGRIVSCGALSGFSKQTARRFASPSASVVHPRGGGTVVSRTIKVIRTVTEWAEVAS